MAEPSRSAPSASEPAHAGEQLRRLRLAAGMTVAEVAERAGVDAGWLARPEADEGTHDVLYSQWVALVQATQPPASTGGRGPRARPRPASRRPPRADDREQPALLGPGWPPSPAETRSTTPVADPTPLDPIASSRSRAGFLTTTAWDTSSSEGRCPAQRGAAGDRRRVRGAGSADRQPGQVGEALNLLGPLARGGHPRGPEDRRRPGSAPSRVTRRPSAWPPASAPSTSCGSRRATRPATPLGSTDPQRCGWRR